MPASNPAAFEFLKTRRSRPAKTLTTPVPDKATLEELLVVAARTPDHGKLEPWRFMILEKPALNRLAEAVVDRGTALGLDGDKIEKMRGQFANGNLVVAVVYSPKPAIKFPQVEQLYSAAAVCLSLVNGALASGWGANWLSGWASHDETFVQEHLGLTAEEAITGFIHIGTETSAPPERPRPDVPSLTTWVSA